ncbi:DUF11 domain-containing protein [Clostridium butyricum]|uniref:Conserved repeat domain protein n=1 Tax=Clostridium butyricum E4 str. BoNT E BL5262 TaxID=632245 RepID=C4IG20_CLOBU|nr:DUF11 domain-containing protein [Clostridium butyricum]EDT76997.1 cell surface protein [Clostridium butyricum 5521]EEP54970.1 conserved repeat domain protein [Clostridium butyricum E4 str. BoNT E BL5262]NFL31764.1 DUF11 domain-containing protein [Clostridium butyricum]NFS18611.1 DUF11 domain-containing protein [Clostridium butyricum]
MALTNTFTTIDKAIIVCTGNTLVLCGSTTAIGANTSDMITSSGGTTRDWTQAGSTAALSILENSTILYAQILWYSTVKSDVSGALDVRSIQDTPITLITPSGKSTITPQVTDSITTPSGNIDRYRSADITSIVKGTLSGNYTVTGVPTSIPSSGLSETRAGWAIEVVYRNDLFKPRKIMFTSGIGYANSAIPLQTTITGFSTPGDQNSLGGNMFLACANGQPLIGNEALQIGPSFASLVTQGNSVTTPNSNPGTAPNNPNNSFFAGQINVCNSLDSSNGLININGTEGNVNHDAFVPTQVVGARNKWDLTNIDISSALTLSQNQLCIQLTDVNDTEGIMILGIGTSVTADAPNITVAFNAFDADGKKADYISIGEQLVYTLQIKNGGNLPATNVMIQSPLDPSCSFVPNSVKLNGNAMQGANPVTGINIGTIAPGGVANIIFTFRVNSLPSQNKLNAYVNYSYSFISGSGSPTTTNNGTTDTMSINVTQSLLSIVKSASVSTASVGDTVNYSIAITNIGTQNAFDILLQDSLSQYSSFNKGTVAINGVLNSSLDPTVGFSLSDIPSGSHVTVTFAVTILSLPPSAVVNNTTLVTFSYNDYASDVTIYAKSIYSNVLPILINYTDIVGERCTNNDYPNVGDTVTYKLNLTNIGNITASNVQVAEPPVSGATFVTGSVSIDGVQKPALNPFTGFAISSIAPQQTTTVLYNVLVNTVDSSRLIQNIATVPFKYQIQQTAPVINSEKDSNLVTTMTSYVNIAITETVDKVCSTIGDTLYYSASITNTGNVDAVNTIFLSAIQSQSTLIPNTVAINGVIQQGFDPNVGFSIGTVCANQNIVVTYQVKVNSVPTPNILYNASSLTYSFYPDPNGNALTNTVSSNTVSTTVNVLNFTIVKSVDKAYAQIGDPLVYDTVITNTGTVVMTNAKFIDQLAAYITLYSGAVYINGTQYTDYDPGLGFSIGDLHPGDSVTVSLGTYINGLPPAGYVPNRSEIVYSYQLCSNKELVTQTKYSNEVDTNVVNGNLSVAKYVDKAYATIGDVLNYSFNISNTGNVTASNLNFTDVIPSGASFVANSVYVNGILQQGFNPNTGFSLGTLNAGQVVSVTFQANITSLPNPNTIINSGSVSFNYLLNPNNPPISKTITSNTVTTVVNASTSTLTKSVDKAYATINDILNYTLVAQNTGTVDITNVFIKDIIPSGASFVSGSVYIDGVNYQSFDPDAGFTHATIPAGGFTTIQFQAKVTSVPNPNTIINSASMTYNYKINPNGQQYSASASSNTVTTTINSVSVTNTKSVDKAYATLQDTLIYTSVITNNSNINITNVNFTDSVPIGTTFQNGTVIINGTSESAYDPNAGFSIGTIAPGNFVTVVFKVTVTSYPSQGYVTNTSSVTYNYNINPTGQTQSGSTASNAVTTYINVGSLTITKSADRQYAILKDVVNYSFIITNTGNTTLSSMSFIDAIQSESSFNSGSVYINGTNYPSYDPNIGFNLSNILQGQFTKITFAVTVNKVPTSGILNNTGSVTYSYYVNPTGSPLTNTMTSNMTTVNVNTAIVTATKTVDKSIAKIGDTITYSFNISNTGNVSATNMTFKDTLDSNISFTNGSVVINGTSAPTFNPNNGFSIPDISGSNGFDTVSFQATVVSRPSGNIVYNYGTIDYNYLEGTSTVHVEFTTNTVETYVASGSLSVTKSVDKTYATIGDLLNYTVVVKNTGSVKATSLTFKDLIATGGTFNQGSVVINGIPNFKDDPDVGFTIPDLVPNGVNTITFAVTVTSLPSSYEIDNFAAITFSYQLTSSDPVQTTTTNSNTVKTYINIGILNVTKNVDLNYATIGNILNYSISIYNSGSVSCSSIMFNDVIQSEASFNKGTVKINGTSYSNYDPTAGFSLSNIAPLTTTTVTFSVTVNAVPKNSYIYNASTVNYSYYINPNNPYINTSATSNTVQTQINIGTMTVTKAVNLAYATINDIIVYTVTVANTGNVPETNINFRDVIPSGLTFIQNSVTINGVAQTGFDPFASFTLGSIQPGGSSIIIFKATVTSVPSPSLISNTASLTYTYRINPSGPDIVNEVTSNAITTQINLGQLTITKAVDKTYATINDVLTYSFLVTNTGNVNTTNAFFLDILQPDATFNSGSVIVNGISQPLLDPTSGFTLGNIATLGVVNLSFTVTIIQNPSKNYILNNGIVNYNYLINPNGQTYSNSASSNITTTFISIGNLASTKTVNLGYATIGNQILYTIVVKNIGNASAYQLFFTDTLSNGASFVQNSVIVDSVPQPSYDPIKGFYLTDLVPGNTSTVQFYAQVMYLPTPSQVTNYAQTAGSYKIDPKGPDYPVSTTSNTVTTQINVGKLSVVKSVDKTYAIVGDTIHYSNLITNTGNVNTTSIKFIDKLQSEASFVTGTVMINGVVNPNLDPTAGFTLSNLAPTQTVLVEFDVKINSLPVLAIVINTSQVQFSYYINPNGSPITTTTSSNPVNTNVVLGSLTAYKIVDKSIATVGDVLNYTITITNVGNVLAGSSVFQDIPSTGVTFNKGSVLINGTAQTSYDPTVGFSLGDIGIGNVVTVQFAVTVNSVPSTSKVTNYANINFEYLVDPKQPPVTKSTTSNTVTTNIALGSLSVTKAVNKAYATIGDILTYTVVVTNIGNINATNVQFLDATPANSIFVAGSVTVNGVSQPSYSPASGFDLGTMTPGQIITVVYKVQVVRQ